MRFAVSRVASGLAPRKRRGLVRRPGQERRTRKLHDGDLGIPGAPISFPACDGLFALFVGSAVTPGQYADDVAAFLAVNPGSTYVHNARACTSLRGFTEEGNRIYGVYYGPFATEAVALASCRLAAAEDAFVKPLDNVTDPGEYTSCSEA